MKYPAILFAIVAIAIPSCSTTHSFINPTNARTATALVCTNALLFAKTDTERTTTANYIYAVAQAIRSLSGGKVPTTDEMKAAINAFTPSGQKYAVLGTNLASIWGAFYPHIIYGQHARSNSAVALDYLESIAAGCEDASASVLLPLAVRRESE